MRRFLLLIAVLSFYFTKVEAQKKSDATAENKSIESYFKPLKYRNIGPFRGGRSVCASGVVGDPLTYYMGNTGGGVWKTEDAGQHWHNISDGYFTTSSVGAIAVSESNPNIVFVGMGEHAPRGVMTTHGDGVYKSIDAGKTWKKMGLEKTQHIARISIHPENPDVVYVAAQGNLYGRNEERGIFKSTDGGTTWDKVLYVDNRTGCSELSMDMNNPHILYATMWEHQRLPWKVISGGPGSGVYKSTDAGKTWNKIESGLPDELGKMAISVCRSNSDKVYALIESETNDRKGGLFVSNNAGASWSRISTDPRLTQRAWYYIETFADPNDENTVYVLSAPALRSIDGGKTWERLSGTHGDYHDLWINPSNAKNVCIANDGGAAISFNYGKSWSRQSNMPTAQFYRVTVDNQFPYRIYGGQQDNTSVVIDSRSFGRGGINETNWGRSAGGESAFLAFDPDNPRFVMGGSYLGTVEIYDNKAKAGTRVMAAPIQYLGRDASEMKYRYNWNAPIIKSQHEPNTFYHAAQYLLRTRDMGKTWDEVSPDLTKNEKDKQGKMGGPYTNEAVGAENYGTISNMMESPHEAGVIWVTTDDGLVQLTRDNGKTWTNVTPAGLQACLVNAVDVSPHDPATAYIATTRYKFNDHTPALYKTTNYGKTWKNITNGIPQGAFTRVVREDDVRKDLLYAGTELGMYISWNGGQQWQSFQLNLPVVPITDLIVKHGDLVVATMGRSFWVLDDLGMIRQYGSKTADVQLYQPEDTSLVSGGSPLNSNSGKGTHPLYGVNPATGVVIYYHLREMKKDEHITLEVKDAKGNLIRTISSKKDADYQRYAGGPPPEPTLSKKEGLNRFVWDMLHSTMAGVPTAYIEGSFRGHKIIPGDYSLTLKVGEEEKNTSFKVLPNPNYPTSQATYIAYDEMMSTMEQSLDEMHKTVNKLYGVQKQMKSLMKTLPESDEYDAIRKDGEDLIKRLKAWDEDMVQRKSKAYDDVENFPNKFTANYIFLLNQTNSSIPQVNQPSMDRKNELDKKWTAFQQRASELLKVDIPAYNQLLWDAGVGALWLEELKRQAN